MNRQLSLHTKVLAVAIGILISFFALAYYYFYVGFERDSAHSRIEVKERYLGQVVELTLRKYLAKGRLDGLKGELTLLLADDEVARLHVEAMGEVVEVINERAPTSRESYSESARDLHDASGRTIGSFTMGFSRRSTLTESRRIQILNGVIIVDLMVLFALVFHLLIKEIVTQPLWQFVEATRQVAQGKFDQTLRLGGASKEEQILAENFNEMVTKLARSQEELQHANLFLEQRVEERTRQLQQSISFNEAVIGTVQEGIYAVDGNWVITTFNQGAERITGMLATEVVGKKCHEVMNYPFCEERCILRRLHRGSDNPETQEEYLEEMQKSGRSWLVTGGIFSANAGDPERFPGGVETIKDLSHTMRLQQQLRQFDKLSSLGTLAAGVAHELNNPLSNIKIHAHLLAEGLEGGAGVDASSIRSIVEQSTRAATIVRKLLEFSGDPQAMRVELLAIDETIARALDMIRYMVEKARIEIELDIPPDLPPIQGNRGSLQQVFINLFTNAYQSMEENGGVLRVSARHETAARKLRIRISDSGTGIAPQDRGRIFDPFFTTKQVGKGTGLGLSISYGIVQDHHGEIEVESSTNEGTTFVLTLPVAPRAAPEAGLSGR